MIPNTCLPGFTSTLTRIPTVCRSKRASKSRPGQGIVELEHIGRNQKGDIVCRAVRATLVQCDPEGGER